MLTVQETLDHYARFLEEKGFAVERTSGPGLTAALNGTSRPVVVVECAGATADGMTPGTVLVFAGKVDRATVDRLTRADVPVVWWNGEFWNGSGLSYTAGFTSK